MGMVERLLPRSKAQWARAMSAEASHLPQPAAFHFAAGCLWAALRQRGRSLAPDGSWFWPSSIVGALILLHALISGSGSLPLIWPLAGGAVAVLAGQVDARPMLFTQAVARSFKAAAASASMFLAGSTLLCLFTNAGLSASLLVRLSVGALAVALLTVLSGVAVAPLVSQAPRTLGTRPGSGEVVGRYTLIAGISLCVLYLVEAILSTGLFFAVWPVLGGISAAALARWAEPDEWSVGAGARAGAKAAAVAGLGLLVVGTPLALKLMPTINVHPDVFGYSIATTPLAALLVMFAGYALFGALVAAVAGAATAMLKRTGPLWT